MQIIFISRKVEVDLIFSAARGRCGMEEGVEWGKVWNGGIWAVRVCQQKF